MGKRSGPDIVRDGEERNARPFRAQRSRMYLRSQNGGGTLAVANWLVGRWGGGHCQPEYGDAATEVRKGEYVSK